MEWDHSMTSLVNYPSHIFLPLPLPSLNSMSAFTSALLTACQAAGPNGLTHEAFMPVLNEAIPTTQSTLRGNDESNEVWVFSYGSNSLAQLRGRIKTGPSLEGMHPAVLHGYERIFVGTATLWGEGGVASLQKTDGEACTHGSVLRLTLEQLQVLMMLILTYTVIIQCLKNVNSATIFLSLSNNRPTDRLI